MSIPREMLEAYSRAEMTRREIENTLDEPVGFGVLLRHLREAGLPLPNIPSDPDKVRLMRELMEQADQPDAGPDGP